MSNLKEETSLPTFSPWIKTFEDAVEHEKELREERKKIKKYAKIFLEREKAQVSQESLAIRLVEKRRQASKDGGAKHPCVHLRENNDFISDVYKSTKKGLTDKEIAEKWGTSQGTVTDTRIKVLGIRKRRFAK